MTLLPLAASVSSGVLLYAAFPPLDAGWIAWLGLVPLLLAMRGARAGGAFLMGWLAGTVAFALTMGWLVDTLLVFTRFERFGAHALHALTAAVLGAYVGLFAWGVTWTRGNSPGTSVLVPAWWVMAETLRGSFPIGFPWLPLGVSQHDASLAHMAAVVGVPGLSALVVTMNVALAEWLADRTRWQAPAVTVSIMVAAALWGSSGAVAPARGPRIGIVQTYEGQDRKWHPEQRDAATERVLSLVRSAAAARPDVVIAPETAIPFALDDDPQALVAIEHAVSEAGVPLVVGSPAAERLSPDRSIRRNRVHLFDSSGRLAGRYDKQLLVPFGEFVPIAGLFPFARPIIQGDAPIGAGGPGGVLRVGSLRLGVITCYEIVAPALAAMRRRDGADMLVNVSNDAWFAGSAASAQLLAQAQLRAIEQGLPLVRVANAGPSAVIDANGAIAWRTSGELASAHVVTVGSVRPVTLYARIGDITVWLAWALVGAAVFRRAVRSQAFRVSEAPATLRP
jgi:apolipoprotein N-acyltransferase